MERTKSKIFLILILILPGLLFSFNSIPRSIKGVSFNVIPSIIPDIVRYRMVYQNVNRLKGEYQFVFDDNKREVIEFRSKYNKVYSIKRYIGIYDRVNYHFRVVEFIKCFKKIYGPPIKDEIRKQLILSRPYFNHFMQWEDNELIMRLHTLFYSSEVNRKYWPGIQGRDIIIEYIHKANKKYIYNRDYNIIHRQPCAGIN